MECVEQEKSYENRVDIMWANILQRYFPCTAGYSIEQQSNPGWKTLNRTDMTIKYIHEDGHASSHLVLECKRHEYQDNGNKWTEAESQAEGYLQQIDEFEKIETLRYAMVAVGMLVRFYYMPKARGSYGSQCLLQFQTRKLGSRALHVNGDAENIAECLEIVERRNKPNLVVASRGPQDGWYHRER